MNSFHGTKNGKNWSFKLMATVPHLGREPLKWSIVKRVRACKSRDTQCHLCLQEKLCILNAEKRTLWNKRSELLAKCRHRNKGCVPFGWSGSWSTIQDTRLLTHQRNRQILSQSGYIGSFDTPWSEWSWIIDPDSDHPKGTHPNFVQLTTNHPESNYFNCLMIGSESWPWNSSNWVLSRFYEFTFLFYFIHFSILLRYMHQCIEHSKWHCHDAFICMYIYCLCIHLIQKRLSSEFRWIVALCIAYCCIPRPQSTMDVTNF